MPQPTTDSGGTRAIAIAAPAAVLAELEVDFSVVYAAITAQSAATKRSRTVGDAREAICAVIS